MLAFSPLDVLLNPCFRFFNGGILFSAVTFVFISSVSLYSFLLLVGTKNVVHGSFGGMHASYLFASSN